MNAVFEVLYWLHVPAALSSVPAFWTATLTRKGGRVHVLSGRWFAYGMIFAALSGAAMAVIILADPLARMAGAETWTDERRAAVAAAREGFSWFLLYLSVITAWPSYHGLRVVRSRRDPAALKNPLHLALAWVPALGSVGVVLFALMSGGNFAPVLLGMSPIGVGLTFLAVGYLRDPARTRGQWRVEHLVSMLAAGIAMHTAFAVFFLGRVLDIHLPGALAILPWVLPTIVGVPAIVIWSRREERRLAR